MNTLLSINFPIDIVKIILEYDGRWRYDKRDKIFISTINIRDYRYSMLDDILCFYMENGYEGYGSSRSRPNTFRMGCTIPIRSLAHLPYYHLLYPSNCITDEIPVQRFLHVGKIIDYKEEFTTQIMRIFSSKHIVYIDSSDTDIDDNDCDFHEYYS